MNKKQIYPLFIVAIFTCNLNYSSVELAESKDFFIDDRPYRKKAVKWVKKYILDSYGSSIVYPKEIQMIANLIYFSFKRSHATLQAQSVALKTLESIWNGWQNIAQTRLDPSKNRPNPIVEHEKNNSLSTFWEYHDQHETMGKTYTQMVDNIVHGDSLFSIHAKNAVDDMRNAARGVVAKSIADIREYVGQLFYNEKKSKKNIKFLDFLWDYLPNLAMTSFVTANNTNDLVSEKSWAVLLKIQQIGKKTWQMIEEERAAFYLAYYKAIWAVMQKLRLENEYRKIMFDQNGEIYLNYQTDYLPDPQTLNPKIQEMFTL